MPDDAPAGGPYGRRREGSDRSERHAGTHLFSPSDKAA